MRHLPERRARGFRGARRDSHGSGPKSDPRNLTNSTSVFEREPVWSPDGKSIAYFSDESGEYALHIREQDGLGEVKKISLGAKPQFYMAPRWSPDSKKIAYLDNHDGIWYMDLETKKPVRVDLDYYRSDRSLDGQRPLAVKFEMPSVRRAP